jgi:hypothetical protein
MRRSFADACCAVRWALLPILGLCVCLASPTRAETLLRWKFVPKDVLPLITSMKMQQEMRINDVTIKSVAEYQVDSHWTIDEVDADGTASMSPTIDRMRMEVQSWQQDVLGQTIKVDSADKEKATGLGAMMAPLIDAMVDKPMTMRVTSRGEISDFKMPAEMLDGLTKSPGAERMGAFFSAEGMKQMVSQAMLKFPSRKSPRGIPGALRAKLPIQRLASRRT